MLIIDSMSEHYLSNVEVRNGTPHPLDILAGNKKKARIPIDRAFQDRKGRPLPIRAEETRDQIGTLDFLADKTPMQLPVDMIRLTGRLDDETRVRKQLRSVYEAVDGPVIVTVSPIAYAALRWAGHDPHISSKNPVGFAIPAGIRREGSEITATRLDQPEPTTLPDLDEEEIERQRQHFLQAAPYGIHGRNYTPTPLEFTNGVTLERTATTEPEYQPVVVGHTTQGTPITRPGSADLRGVSHHTYDAHFVHPRGLTTLRQSKPQLIGQSFMPSPERLKNGTFTREVGRLAVFDSQSLTAVAHQVA